MASLTSLAEVADIAWRTRPDTFAEVVSEGKWQTKPHLKLIADKIIDAIMGGKKLLINAPPRSGKSELISKWVPVWYLDIWPEKRVILTSYEATFASEWGKKVRDTITESEHTWTKLQADSTARSLWHTDKGGGMVTAGVGGPITGRGGNLIIVDDPVKNWQEAISPVYQQATIDWFESTLMTRCEPGAAVVLLMTRWHEMDLSGHILDKYSDWEHITIPLLAEKDDQAGRRAGELLWPERFSQIDFEERAKDPIKFAALYQQRPLPQGGKRFDAEAIEEMIAVRNKPMKTPPSLSNIPFLEVFDRPQAGEEYVIGVDSAEGLSGGDNACISVWGRNSCEQVAVVHGLLNPTMTARYSVELARAYNEALIAPEREGIGLATVSAIAANYRNVYRHREEARLEAHTATRWGWSTNGKTKPLAIDNMAKQIGERSAKFNHLPSLKEARAFLMGEEAPVGLHDDTVMANAIALYVRATTKEFKAEPFYQG